MSDFLSQDGHYKHWPKDKVFPDQVRLLITSPAFHDADKVQVFFEFSDDDRSLVSSSMEELKHMIKQDVEAVMRK